MKFIADLHIHSHFSIATSKQLCPEHLDHWARIKGIQVVGTGDFTHPGWLKELKEKCRSAEPGLYRLKDEYRIQQDSGIKIRKEADTRFLLTAEISNIYKKDGKVRKVHNVVFAPDFETVEKIQHRLSALDFNITSDGRPILGLDSRDLLELCLDVSDQIFFVPAHIWTPWFSALGDKSGFETIEACYGDLTDHIYTVETGLSSDPAMNWMCGFLDPFTLISNSDAHSPEKLGREANLFNTDVSYFSITDALKTGDERFLGTVEFFPQEGKYHYDGHRKCGICWNPLQTLENKGVCPKCGKKVTVGVMNRIAQLSDRDSIEECTNKRPFHSIVPLKEILSELYGVGPNSKKIGAVYAQLIQKAGSEFNVLLHASLPEIQMAGGELLSEAVERMRCGNVHIQEGYDGEYGIIRVFQEEELKNRGSQSILFSDKKDEKTCKESRNMIRFDLKTYREMHADMQECEDSDSVSLPVTDALPDGSGLNTEQQKAVQHPGGPMLVLAGPGTGKTRVLTERIMYLIESGQAKPEQILAVTFTNKAACEMKQRLTGRISSDSEGSLPRMCTFHAFGYDVLKVYAGKIGRTKTFVILDEEKKNGILRLLTDSASDKPEELGRRISLAKQEMRDADQVKDDWLAERFKRYEELLCEQNLFDLDDLIYQTVRLLKSSPDLLLKYQKQFPYILIDEYQDINEAQYQLIQCLTSGPESDLCVIGDPDQAIYGFRGADVRFIHDFVKDFPAAAVYSLKKSYRCTEPILNASSGVLRNRMSKKATLQGLQTDIKINIVRYSSDKSEAEFVARTIEAMMGGLRFFSIDSDITRGDNPDTVRGLNDFAVLCRISRQMAAVEKAFRDHNIPFQKVTETTLFQKPFFRDLVSLIQYSDKPEHVFLRKTVMPGITGGINDAQIKEIKEKKSLPEKVKKILSLGTVKKQDAEKAEWQRFLSVCEQYHSDVDGFLRMVSIGAPADDHRPDIENVSLLTMHASKGLEFQCVFIIGCEDGLIPYSLFDRCGSPDEEERLLYVAMTRARKYLYLSHAQKRMLFGRMYELPRSPFLDRIEKEWIRLSAQQAVKKLKKADNQINLF